MLKADSNVKLFFICSVGGGFVAFCSSTRVYVLRAIYINKNYLAIMCSTMRYVAS